jgi:uncharacterized protein
MSGRLELRRYGDDRLIVPRLEVAATFWGRFVGLQGRRMLASDQALLLAPCSSVHTFFMRFPLAIGFLDRSGAVLDFREQVAPWRIAGPVAAARFVVEGNVGKLQLARGERLYVQCDSGVAPRVRQRLEGLLRSPT